MTGVLFVVEEDAGETGGVDGAGHQAPVLDRDVPGRVVEDVAGVVDQNLKEVLGEALELALEGGEPGVVDLRVGEGATAHDLPGGGDVDDHAVEGERFDVVEVGEDVGGAVGARLGRRALVEDQVGRIGAWRRGGRGRHVAARDLGLAPDGGLEAEQDQQQDRGRQPARAGPESSGRARGSTVGRRHRPRPPGGGDAWPGLPLATTLRHRGFGTGAGERRWVECDRAWLDSGLAPGASAAVIPRGNAPLAEAASTFGGERPVSLAVLVSGTGRTLENFLTVIGRGELNARITVVVSSVPGVRGLRIAEEAGIPTAVVRRSRYDSDTAFSEAVYAAIAPYAPDLILLAGFLRRLVIPREWRRRILNIHPGLLPEGPAGRGFYGERVHAAVLASGASESGATVHVVDEEYDTGPVVLRTTVPVLPGDTPETLGARVFAAECELYPEAVRQYVVAHPDLRRG